MAMKSGAAHLLSSLIPGLDMDAIGKAAGAAGQKIESVESSINRIEAKLDKIAFDILEMKLAANPNAIGSTPLLEASFSEEIQHG